MFKGCAIVVDVGKTNSKVSLWNAEGRLLDRRSRANQKQTTAAYPSLDVEGIDAWLMECLSEYARQGDISVVIPVAHGAAAALVRGNRLIAEPMDYEDEVSARDREAYDLQRDPFSVTGSPALPCGLNLGMQLHRIELMGGRFSRDLTIVPWPQYWAWRLCGVMASEVSSLGCHTDLWRPAQATFSDLAVRRGWASRMAPIRGAAHVLGTVTPQIARQTGLPRSCLVLCGMHDTNAALLAAKGHREIADNDATVLSTGTWFVAMRSAGSDERNVAKPLPEARDCLINVDVFGRLVPSARFMGGREAQLIGGVDSFALMSDQDPDALLTRLPALLARGAAVYPSFVRGVGPFPGAVGEWRNEPVEPGDRRVVTGLYLAMMADTVLDLIGSRDRLLIEGRFAEEVIFIRALAALRPKQQVFISNAHQDVAYGALRLVCPGLPPPSDLTPVKPLEIDLRGFANEWRKRASRAQVAA